MKHNSAGKLTIATQNSLLTEDGSILIEIALALPVILLLLLGGLDLGRYIQLVQKSDQAAVLLAESLAQNGADAAAGIDNMLQIARTMLAQGSVFPHVEVIAESYILSPSDQPKTEWSRTAGSVPLPCAAIISPPRYQHTVSDPSAPHQYLIGVHICSVARDGFYLSGLLSLENLAISSAAFRHQTEGSDRSEI